MILRVCRVPRDKHDRRGHQAMSTYGFFQRPGIRFAKFRRFSVALKGGREAVALFEEVLANRALADIHISK